MALPFSFSVTDLEDFFGTTSSSDECLFSLLLATVLLI